MKATEFPFEEINKAAHCSKCFTFYQIIDNKNCIYWEIPTISSYELDAIKEILKYTYFSIYAQKGRMVISFFLP